MVPANVLAGTEFFKQFDDEEIYRRSHPEPILINIRTTGPGPQPFFARQWRFENKIAIFDQLMATTQCSLRSVSCAALNQVPRSRVWFCYAPADEGQTSVYVYLTWRPYLIPLTMIYRCSTTQSAMERQFVLRGSAMQLFSWYLFFELYVGLYCSDTSSTVFIELFSCLRKQSLYVLGWQGRLDTLELTSPKFLTWFNDEDITDAFPRL